ncbi:hypothetical protein D050_1958B, partial [Vibrio parahaemolyticus VPCR-2009]
GSVFNN